MRMMDTHYNCLYNIVKDIALDKVLSPLLIFKGGTSLMFFYDLPRFSLNLEFTLVDRKQELLVFKRLLKIVSMYGTICEKVIGLFGAKVVLEYGEEGWPLEVEISNQYWREETDLLCLDGFSQNVMSLSDIYTHKLIALGEGSNVTGKEIFDIWFLGEKFIIPNGDIVMKWVGRSLAEQLSLDISILAKLTNDQLISSLEPLLLPEKAKWASTSLLPMAISSLQCRLSAEKLKKRFRRGISLGVKYSE